MDSYGILANFYDFAVVKFGFILVINVVVIVVVTIAVRSFNVIRDFIPYALLL